MCAVFRRSQTIAVLHIKRHPRGARGQGSKKPWALMPQNVLDYESSAFLFLFFSYEGTRGFFQVRRIDERAFILKPKEKYILTPGPSHACTPRKAFTPMRKKPKTYFYECVALALCHRFVEDAGKKWDVYTNHFFECKKTTRRQSGIIFR